jgi:hypothetical protein
VSAQDDTIEQVYEMVVKSQKTGITIDQIARRLEGDILAPHYVAELIRAMRITSIFKGIKEPAHYVATTLNKPVEIL